MADPESTPRYRVKMIPVRGEPFDDVIYCACFKLPFLKKASFWTLKINVSSIWAQQLFADLSNPISKIRIELKINEVSGEGTFDSTAKDGRLIHFKDYHCIQASTCDGLNVNPVNPNCEIYITLVDHIIYDMSIKNVFNRKFSDKTAFEVLEEFEKCLKEQYGDKVFLNSVGRVGITDEVKSTFKYEEMLVALTSDLQVTDMLLYSRKMLKDMAFYFYDDFYLDKTNTNCITNHFICFSDITKFKPYDLRKHYELHLTQNIKTEPFTDSLKLYTQGYDSFIWKTKYMFDLQEPPLEMKTVYRPTIDTLKTSEYNINSERESVVQSATYSDINFKASKVRKKCMSIYVPDKKEHAQKRFDNYNALVNSKIKQIVTFETRDCFCDWLQFGRAYNLDQVYPEDYSFTPISICNIFYKDGSERTTKHTVKYITVQYYRPDEQEKLCSSCKYFQGNSCILHYSASTGTNKCEDHVV